jgi:very-short-patch-repair endonuclease
VGRLAERQHGVVGRRQVLELGLAPHQIDRRLASGAWLRVGFGVYAIGHARLDRHARLLAAVLASGSGAVLSHLSAAELLELITWQPARFHVTVPTGGGRRLPGVVVHRRAAPIDSSTVHGIPATAAAQAILDCAPLVSRRAVERMIDQADRRRLCTYDELHEATESFRGHRGAGILRDVLVEHEAGSTVTASHLEELFLALCRREGLPTPEVNVEVEGLTADFYWPEHRVAVETDGWSSHRPRERFQHDIDRGNRFLLADILALRFSYDDVTAGARTTARDLRRALRSRGLGIPSKA